MEHPALPNHRLQSHTSEVELYIRARSWSDLLAEAGRGWAELELGDLEPARARSPRTIELTSIDREALLVDWLNELVSVADIDRWVGVEFVVESATANTARVQVRGVTVERGSTRVKAATFHGLHVREIDGVWDARVILDV